MFNLEFIIKWFLDSDNVTKLITIITFVLTIINIFLVYNYKRKCEKDYNIPKNFFNVNTISKFASIGIFILLSILLVMFKKLDGIQYIFVQCIGYLTITLLFGTTIDDIKFSKIAWISLVLFFIKIISDLTTYLKFNISDVLFIIWWLCLIIYYFFISKPINETKYKIIDLNNNGSLNDIEVVLSKFNGDYLVVKGEIKDNSILVLKTKDYYFVSPRSYKLEKIKSKKNILEENYNNELDKHKKS